VLAEECKKKGVALLGKYVYPFQVFWSRKKLTTLADVSGQKLRVTSPEQAEFVKALGGVPITLGTAEVAAALDRGVVDGVTTAASGYGHIWKDLLKYCYRVNICFVDSLLIANERAWNKLSEDHRKVVVKAVDDITPKTTAAMADEEQKYFDELAKGGMTIIQPTAAEVGEAEAKIKPYWDNGRKSAAPTPPRCSRRHIPRLAAEAAADDRPGTTGRRGRRRGPWYPLGGDAGACA
jgi:TRAP-type C4-dicarboxylate transport system substrate-binding protein